MVQLHGVTAAGHGRELTAEAVNEPVLRPHPSRTCSQVQKQVIVSSAANCQSGCESSQVLAAELLNPVPFKLERV